MASFKLSKWYLDLVTDAGDTMIVYAGIAQGGKLRLHYSSVLETANDRIAERYSLRRPLDPVVTSSTISWQSKALKVDGNWNTMAPGVGQTIYRCAMGFIDWDCRMPLAVATIGDRQGLGYVEKLTMTISPGTCQFIRCVGDGLRVQPTG